MELLIPVGTILIAGAVGYIIVSIQEWITDMRFYRRSTQKELNRLRRSLGKVECASRLLAPIKPLNAEDYITFDKAKVGVVTGVVGEKETLSEAERILKEARERACN